jgi:hypothetical protein
MDKFEEILKKYIGFPVKDNITGIEGIVTSISFDLYGCVQALVDRGLDKNGEFLENGWYDINRLRIIKNKRVMDCPHLKNEKTIIDKGPALKPSLPKTRILNY